MYYCAFKTDLWSWSWSCEFGLGLGLGLGLASYGLGLGLGLVALVLVLVLWSRSCSHHCSLVPSESVTVILAAVINGVINRCNCCRSKQQFDNITEIKAPIPFPWRQFLSHRPSTELHPTTQWKHLWASLSTHQPEQQHNYSCIFAKLATRMACWQSKTCVLAH